MIGTNAALRTAGPRGTALAVCSAKKSPPHFQDIPQCFVGISSRYLETVRPRHRVWCVKRETRAKCAIRSSKFRTLQPSDRLARPTFPVRLADATATGQRTSPSVIRPVWRIPRASPRSPARARQGRETTLLQEPYRAERPRPTDCGASAPGTVPH